MQNHPLYHITHVPLHNFFPLPLPNIDKQGEYLVFWWHHLALGHLYIRKGAHITEAEYHQKLTESILPTVLFYTNDRKVEKENLLLWLNQQEYDRLQTFLEETFSKHVPKSMPTKVPVSVIVCTHNRTLQLQQCLEKLINLSCAPEEIIVVDNAPADDSSAAVVQCFKDAVYVKEPRKGLDIARNTGIKRASLPIVAFVDDDVTVHPSWLYYVWLTFQNPDTAAMTGLVIASELHSRAQYIFEKHWSFNRGYTDIYFDSSYFNKVLPQGPPVWNIGAGANMAFRKQVFEEVGYFDELLDVGAAGCSGDSEMWYRILAHGHAIHYNPRAVVFHQHRREIEGLKSQIFYYMRGHAAAALIQQRQHQEAGYARYLFWRLPKRYVRMARQGFPRYQARYTTLWSEITGVLSGMLFYARNRSQRS